MPSHDGHQVFLAVFLDALILGNHHHAISHFSCTGVHQVTLTLDLNHTDAAAFPELSGLGIFDFMFAVKNGLNGSTAFSGRQVRMVTQTGDIDVYFAGGFQNRRPGRHLHRLSVDGHPYSAHFH